MVDECLNIRCWDNAVILFNMCFTVLLLEMKKVLEQFVMFKPHKARCDIWKKKEKKVEETH